MDPRVQAIFAAQQASGFRGLAGSDVHATLRLSADLLNQAARAFVPSMPAVRELVLEPRAGNRIEVRVALARPAFLPALHVTVEIERQALLPSDPVLVLRLSGAGGMVRLAGPAIASFGVLPAGIRIQGEHLFVDLSALLARYGQAQLLQYAEQLLLSTDEGVLVANLYARVK